MSASLPAAARAAHPRGQFSGVPGREHPGYLGRERDHRPGGERRGHRSPDDDHRGGDLPDSGHSRRRPGDLAAGTGRDHTGSTQLPPGATGVACDYHASGYNVIIELISNIAPSSITNFTKNFPVPPAAVSGVGDQAESFSQTLGPGRVNEGVVATKGMTLVSIGATYTPATLAQVEALVNSLL